MENSVRGRWQMSAPGAGSTGKEKAHKSVSCWESKGGGEGGAEGMEGEYNQWEQRYQRGEKTQ